MDFDLVQCLRDEGWIKIKRDAGTLNLKFNYRPRLWFLVEHVLGFFDQSEKCLSINMPPTKTPHYGGYRDDLTINR